jgi:hypothetical protein
MKHAVDATRPRAARQRLGPAGRRRRAPRLHHQRHVLRPETPDRGGLPQRHQGREEAHLRMIGDPATRYREDPVRIIRAVRFAAKLSALGFTLDAKTAAPLVKSQACCWPMCRKAACLTKCSSCCRPAMRWPAIEQLRKLGWRGHLPAAGRGGGARRRSPLSTPPAKTPTAAWAKANRWRRASAGLRAVGRCARRLGTACAQRQHSHPRCRMPSTRCSTHASAMCRAAASWPATCARSG